MPLHTLPRRPDAPLKRSQIDTASIDFGTEIRVTHTDSVAAPPMDHDLAADVVARMLDGAGLVPSRPGRGRIAHLSSFLSDAAARTPGHGLVAGRRPSRRLRP